MSKETNIETIEINGTKYIKESDMQKAAETMDGMEYVIVRTYSAGVFAGYLEKQNGKEVLLRKAKRIWHWSGANSLSQLSVDGTLKPSECKIAVEVDKIYLTEAIEIIPTTEKAKISLNSVTIWKLQ